MSHRLTALCHVNSPATYTITGWMHSVTTFESDMHRNVHIQYEEALKKKRSCLVRPPERVSPLNSVRRAENRYQDGPHIRV